MFIEKLNVLILDARAEVRQRGNKDLVLIVDGLEKMHYRLLNDGQSTHAHLFVHHYLFPTRRVGMQSTPRCGECS